MMNVTAVCDGLYRDLWEGISHLAELRGQTTAGVGVDAEASVRTVGMDDDRVNSRRLHLASNACVYTNLTNREISVTGNLPAACWGNSPNPLIDRTVPVRLRPALQCYFSC